MMSSIHTKVWGGVAVMVVCLGLGGYLWVSHRPQYGPASSSLQSVVPVQTDSSAQPQPISEREPAMTTPSSEADEQASKTETSESDWASSAESTRTKRKRTLHRQQENSSETDEATEAEDQERAHIPVVKRRAPFARADD